MDRLQRDVGRRDNGTPIRPAETRIGINGEEHAALLFVDEVSGHLVVAVGLELAQRSLRRAEDADFAGLEAEDVTRRGTIAGARHGAEREFAAFFKARPWEDVANDLAPDVELEEVRERVGIHQHRDAFELERAVVRIMNRDEWVDRNAEHVVIPHHRIHQGKADDARGDLH